MTTSYRPPPDVNLLSTIMRSQRTHLYSGVMLAAFFGFFAYAHLNRFQETREWALLLVVISETLTTGFFIFRSEPKTVSVASSDWMVAVAGSFAPMFLRPASWGLLPSASIVIALGTMLQIVSLLSLNRSFALVPAKKRQ